MEEYTSISDFYAGKTVFITGGTGFLGKVLIEKLVYSCPKLKKIYVLIRPTEKQTLQQRFQHFINDLVFTRVKNERADVLNKIVPIGGDLCEANLGLEPHDENILVNEVSVVIHSGATVKFNEELSIAMKINYEGTEKVIKLCHKMKNLKVLVHISTAYSHTEESILEECIYPQLASVTDVYRIINSDGSNGKEVAKLLNGQPNTYTFTKALTENLIADTHKNIPTIIIRPSVVTPGLSEPVRGWVDNWNGATGLLTLIAKGICHAIPGKNEHILDFIPVDYVSNLTLAAAAKCKSFKNLTILNCSSSSCNPITIKRAISRFNEVAVNDKFNTFPYPDCLVVTSHTWLVVFISFIFKMVVGAADFVMGVVGKKTRYLKMYSKLDIIINTVGYFLSHSWVFRCDSVLELNSTLSDSDRRIFPFNPTNIDWQQYMLIYYEGVKKYLMKSDG